MLRPPIKIILLVLWTALWFLPVWATHSLKFHDWKNRFIKIFCHGALYIAGIKLKVTGKLSDVRPLMLVSNHLTYCDILMLASQATLCFTPKWEIGNWPFVGGLCRMLGCVFIERRADKLKETSRVMQGKLAQGEVISIFPEATTGNGLEMLPFKSGFFNLCEEPVDGRPVYVQPAAITYTRVRRLPVDSTLWPRIAWYGDMYLLPHLWDFLALGSIEAELIFLPPLSLAECGDRKQLAKRCQQAIAEAIEEVRANRGQRMEAKPRRFGLFRT